MAFNFNDKIKANFNKFFIQLNYISKSIVNSEFNDIERASYLIEFATFYDTWLMNKYIGGGIKNFRYYCHIRPNVDKNSTFYIYWDQRFAGGEHGRKVIFKCNMHPHNYYLEIMTETGIFGLVLILLIFSIIFYKTFVKKYFYKTELSNNIVITPFIFLFIAEIFPIKSSGSFFTTGNSTYIFLLIGIMIGILRRKNTIENRI